MRSPTCIVSTLRRWRLFRPWIVNPCSRVLRKLSGELTIIQNWEARPSVRPDFRLRRGRPDLAGLSPVGGAGVSGRGLGLWRGGGGGGGWRGGGGRGGGGLAGWGGGGGGGPGGPRPAP